MKRISRIEISLLAAVVFSAVLSICSLNIECGEIRSSVLRLNVFDNSDSQ